MVARLDMSVSRYAEAYDMARQPEAWHHHIYLGSKTYGSVCKTFMLRLFMDHHGFMHGIGCCMQWADNRCACEHAPDRHGRMAERCSMLMAV